MFLAGRSGVGEGERWIIGREGCCRQEFRGALRAAVDRGADSAPRWIAGPWGRFPGVIWIGLARGIGPRVCGRNYVSCRHSEGNTWSGPWRPSTSCLGSLRRSNRDAMFALRHLQSSDQRVSTEDSRVETWENGGEPRFFQVPAKLYITLPAARGETENGWSRSMEAHE